MDPKLAQNLDPKLKETYDRIMGTQVNSSHPVQASAPTPEPAPAPAPQDQATVQASAKPVEPAPTAPAQPEMVNINATVGLAKPVTTAAVSKKKMSPMIFIMAGVGFFLIYTVIWLKVFSIF